MTNHRWLRSSLLFLLCWFLFSCSQRAPGPLEQERGRFTYWRLRTVSPPTYGERCSDSDTVRPRLELDKFEQQSLFLYELSDDGSQATLQECTGIQRSSCSPSARKINFSVDGNVLTWSGTTRVKATSYYPCPLDLTRTWRLTDKGQEMSLETTLTLKVVSSELKECSLQEDDIRRRSTNKQGLDACVVTQTIVGDFYQVD